VLHRFAVALALAGTVLGPAAAVLVGAAEPDRALTDAERERIERGELVVRTRAVEGFPWPEVTVYARVAAAPAEVMAVYADFDAQATFLPEMVQSRIVERDGPTAWRVFYEYEVAGPNERYTVAVRLGRVAGGYQATWNLITARYARRLGGEMRVVENGDGSLVRYVSRVDPGTLGVTLGSPESVERRLRVTVQALARHVERLRTERPDALTALVRTLRLAMDGRPEAGP
jgi:hypothetical protein